LDGEQFNAIAEWSKAARMSVHNPSRTAGDLWSTEWPERKHFWGPITEGSLTMLYAKPGIGKSYLGYKIIHAAVSGVKFLKWEGCGTVEGFFADGEMGPQTITERIIKIDDGSSKKIIGGAMRFLTYADCEGSVLWNISDPMMQRRYEEIFEHRRIIIIDNLVTAAREMYPRDDDFQMWARIQPWLIQLRDKGFAVILVHHAGKSGSQLGTSKRDVIMDTVIELTEVPHDDPCERLKFDLHFRKARHFFGEDAQSLRVEMFAADDGGLLWNWYPATEIREHRIAYYQELGLTTRQIATEMGIELSAVMQIVQSRRHAGSNDEF
jgi:AAA domain